MLPYQEKIIAEILAITDINNADILEIGGTPPWTVANKLIDSGAKSVSLINYRSDLEDKKVSEKIDFYNIDARGMSDSLTGKYDLIFGIAVLEHLPNLDIVLNEASKLLRNGGKVAFHGAAFWSSNLGHHIFVHVDDVKYEFNANNPIDDFSHLYFDNDEMYHNLVVDKGLPQRHATAIVDYIYRNPILNRYHYEDILGSFCRAGFSIEYFRCVDWCQPSQEVRQRILTKMGPHYNPIYTNYSCGEMILIASHK